MYKTRPVEGGNLRRGETGCERANYLKRRLSINSRANHLKKRLSINTPISWRDLVYSPSINK
jgi:hypothetical protein